MNTGKGASGVAMHITYGCLVVPVPVELHDNTLSRVREEVLAKVLETRVKGVIIDLSAVSVIDSFAAGILNDTARSVSLLGAAAVISGIKPGTAVSLVDLDLYFEGITKVSSLEEGFHILRSSAAHEGGPGMKHDEIEVPISEEIDIVKAAFEGKNISKLAGFAENAQFMISTAVSELARNIYKFAGKGIIRIKLLDRENRKGIEIIAEDNGPGISNPAQALEDHFSTAATLGLGLPGVKRMMDEFTIDSVPGKGTKITARKWG
jgi:serine/threonine-protein kinase RsbT